MVANAPTATKAALVDGRLDVGVLPTGQQAAGGWATCPAWPRSSTAPCARRRRAARLHDGGGAQRSPPAAQPGAAATNGARHGRERERGRAGRRPPQSAAGPPRRTHEPAPPRGNAQNARMTYVFEAAFNRAAQDDEVKVIVPAGAGKHFSVGHDIGTPGRDIHQPLPPRRHQLLGSRGPRGRGGDVRARAGCAWTRHVPALARSGHPSPWCRACIAGA